MTNQASFEINPSAEQHLAGLRDLFKLQDSSCRYWANLPDRYKSAIVAEAGLHDSMSEYAWEQFNDSERTALKCAVAGFGAVMNQARYVL
jgi:hypothetical protein